MKNITIAAFFIVLIGCSGNQQTTKTERQTEEVPASQLLKSGLRINYGPNLGTSHRDTLGVKNFYVHITATITNDSTIPIQLQLALAKEYEYPAFCGDEQYKVFLLPEELTPDTADIYNNIVNGQHDFLNAPIDSSGVLTKKLDPGEYCVVTIGTLTPQPSDCAAVPRAIFSQDSSSLYLACDKAINEAISTGPQLELQIKLEYYYDRKFITPEDGCAVIPFGQISYREH